MGLVEGVQGRGLPLFLNDPNYLEKQSDGEHCGYGRGKPPEGRETFGGRRWFYINHHEKDWNNPSKMREKVVMIDR